MRVDQPFLKLPMRFCAETLAAEVHSLPTSAWLPHPQGYPGNDAVPLVSPGGEVGDQVEGAMAPTEHLRRMPYVASVMFALGCVWGRSRLMGLGPGAEVRRHVDIHYYWRTHVRIHIPIVTNPGVRFTCGGETVHMAPGECWVFNSFEPHNVQNGGSERRVHLVLDTVGGTHLWDLMEAARRGTPVPEVLAVPSDARTEADELLFEQVNAPKIMSPYEIRCHVDYLRAYIMPGPLADAVLQQIDRFIASWEASWARFGDRNEGVATYREVLARARSELASDAEQVMMRNGPSLWYALDALVFWHAIAEAPQPARPNGGVTSTIGSRASSPIRPQFAQGRP